MPSLDLVTADFLDDAPFRIVVDVPVMAPIDACWDLLVDQASWVQWFDEMSSVDATPWTWTEPGQTRTVTVNKMKVEETAISVTRHQEYAFAINKWPLPVAKRAAEGVRLEDKTNRGSARTILTYIGAFELTAIGRLAEGMLTKNMTAAWTGALKQLGTVASDKAAAHG